MLKKMFLHAVYKLLLTSIMCYCESFFFFAFTNGYALQNVLFHILTWVCCFSVKWPPSTIANSSIAYIAGLVARAVEERKICSFCPSLDHSDGSGPALMGLIGLQSRGGLTFPKPEFVTVLVTVKKAVDIALPQIKKSNVRQQLAELLLPRLEKCTIFICPASDDHATSTLSVVFDQIHKAAIK